MDMDPEDEAFLRRFETLPKSRRQLIYHGVLERLRLDEYREVKAYVEGHTLQCDILGKMPPETADLVAQYLPLTDIIRLRRVSRRWHSILSSQSLCRAAVRKILGTDPWVHPTPFILNTLTAPSTTGSSFDFGTSFTSFVKRRYRLERGKPHKVISMPSPVTSQPDHIDRALSFSYSKGICTWIDENEDKTSVATLNLSTGERNRFTTPNREKLLCVKSSGSTIVAISLRGFCHVWNYDDTSQFSSFRVPSLNCNLILIKGKHIVLEYMNYIVHWSWETRILRTINTADKVITIAPHPSEDQIEMIHFCQNEDCRSATERTLSEDKGEAPTSNEPTYHLQTTRYTLNSENEWYASSSHPAPISMDFPMAWQWGSWRGRRKEVKPGQSSIRGVIEDSWERNEEGQNVCMSVYLSIEPNGLVAMHRFPREFHDGHHFVNHEEGIVYFSIVSDPDWGFMRYGIAKSTDVTGPSDRYISLDYSVQRVQDVKEPLCILGDSKFMVFLGESTMDIWVMEENAMDETLMEEMKSAGLNALFEVETD